MACCTGAGTGTCEAIQLGCTGNSQPFPCCTGAGTGSCPLPTKGSCNVICPGESAPVRLQRRARELLADDRRAVCGQGLLERRDAGVPGGRRLRVAGHLHGNAAGRGVPGDNQCVPQTGPKGVTQCFVLDPVNALGQPVAGVTCSVGVM